MFGRSLALSPLVAASLVLGCGDDASTTPSPDTAADTTSDTSSGSDADTSTESDGDSSADAGPTDPGSLLELTMSSTVGVLLDEIPESAREVAIAWIEARPESFWEDRARRQIEATGYRLIFRNLYFDPSEGKGIIPLPPMERWNIVFSGPASLRQIDGHAVYARDYDFTGVLLGPADQAEQADARLAAPGAVVEEPFVLPVDPEHIFERTDFACMNEADFPPNSVDTENARSFYDDTCEGGVMVEDDGCHLSYPIPELSCPDAVRAHIGAVETSMRVERLAWDAAIADAARVGQQIPGVAELRAMPEGVADNRIVYRYFAPDSCAISEGCVGGAGWRRLLQFTATVQNLGAVDSAIGDVSPGTPPVTNRLVSMSECHGHMHFNHYGKFTFGSGDAQLGSKRAFCLESTWRYFNNEDTPFTHPYTCSFQGTAAGWGDDYIAGLDCQWVDVTPVDTTGGPVTSDLAFHVNPDKFLCEGTVVRDEAGLMTFEETTFTNEAGEFESRIACEERDGAADNNVATASVELPVATGGLVTTPCTRGLLGERRNCGFVARDSVDTGIDCTPGAQTTVTCTGGSPDKPVVARVCEASSVLGVMPCLYREALGSTTLTGAAVDVTFTCPEARSAEIGENGGKYGVYFAPAIEGDPALGTCAPKAPPVR
jgi:hypothetical protein